MLYSIYYTKAIGL